MSSPQRNSDTEGSEKPVRERLRNTSIAVAATTRNGTVYQSTETAEVADSVPETMPSTEEISTSSTKEVTTTEPFKDATPPREEDQDRGRPSRKRSHEDMGEDTPDEPAPKTRHARKRSRETVEDEQQDVSPDSIISEDHPQNKADTNGTVKTAVPQRVASTNKRPTPASDQDDPTSVVDIASPKSKKSRPDETKLNDASQPPQVAPAQAADSEKPKVDSSAAVVESATEEKKSQELPTALDKPSVEGEQPPTAKPAAIPSTSGFANVSSSSPFGALAGSKSPADQNTSTSAFKASGFGALSNSTPSGFGSLSGPPSKLSSFSSSSAAPAPAAADAAIENDKTTPKTFGGAMGTASGFASAKTGSSSAFSGALGASSSFASAGTGNVSAFGGKSGGVLSPPGGKSGFSSGLGGGFGGGFGGMGGSKLGSFASSGTPGVIGGFSKPARQFGAAPDDEEGEDGSGAEDDAAGEAKPDNDDEKDERFFEQEIETGEEDERTEYTCRAKLYNFVKAEDGTKKEWKERGLGVIRLNVKIPGPEDEEAAPKARLVMRADGSHRVVLNTPILKSVKFGSVTGEAPVGGYVYFMGSIDGSAKLELLQMKLRQQFAQELYGHIDALQQAM